MAVDIEIKEIKPHLTAAVDYTTSMDKMSEAMGGVFGEVMGAMGSSGVKPDGMPFSMYPKMEPASTGEWEVISGFPVDQPIAEQGRVKTIELPGGTVAVATHMGPYDTLEQTYKAKGKELPKLGYETAGPMWESYFTDPMKEPDPAKWRTDIYWPVRKI